MVEYRKRYGNGSVYLYRGKRGDSWYYRFRDYSTGKPSCRQIKLGTMKSLPTKKAALLAAEHLKLRSSAGSLHGLVRERIVGRKSLPLFTQDWFNLKLQEQEGRCAICGRTPARLIVDHDHTDGEKRGLLCHQCNVGIGMLRDDPTIVRAAMIYLESYDRPKDQPLAQLSVTTPTQ